MLLRRNPACVLVAAATLGLSLGCTLGFIVPAGALAQAATGASHAAQPAHGQTPEQHFQAAVTAQQQGHTAQAIRLYQSLLRAHPESLAVRVNLAGLLVEQSRYTEAIDLYREGLRLAPASRDLQLGLAYAYGRQGTPAGLQAASRALALLHQRDPADEKAAMLLADSLVRQQQFAQAVPLLAPLQQVHPQDIDIGLLSGAALLGAGHADEAVQVLDALAAATGSADAYLLAGQIRLDRQQFDLARTDALAALAKAPAIAGGQTLLGRSLEHLGDYDASVATLRKAIAADDTDFQAHFYLGAVLLFQRDLQGAEKQLRRALALDPGSAEARYKLALVEQGQGRADAALADLQAVVAARPKWLEPRTALVAALYKLHRNEEAASAKEAADRLAATQQPGAPTGATP